MTATAHALVGAMFAAYFPNPFVCVTFSFASHFPLDLIPHWDVGTNKEKKQHSDLFRDATLDVLLSFFAGFIFYFYILHGENLLLLITSIFAAQLPDWMFVPYVFFKARQKIFVFLYKFQENIEAKLDLPWGIVTQIITLVTLYVVMFELF